MHSHRWSKWILLVGAFFLVCGAGFRGSALAETRSASHVVKALHQRVRINQLGLHPAISGNTGLFFAEYGQKADRDSQRGDSAQT